MKTPHSATPLLPDEAAGADLDAFGSDDEPGDHPPARHEPEAPAVPITEPPRESIVDAEENMTKRNPWLPMETAPEDRIIEGRFFEDEEIGRPIRWRNSRHRATVNGRPQWVEGGVWHAAETAGAVRLHPIGWREWRPVAYFAPAPKVADAEAA